jgi:hypothetical protein
MGFDFFFTVILQHQLDFVYSLFKREKLARNDDSNRPTNKLIDLNIQNLDAWT